MEEIFKSAIRFGEGEFAWETQNIPNVVSVLVKQNKAIVGAEVWILTKDKKIRELYWFNFEISDKKDSELWNDYVIGTSIQFLQSFYSIKDNRRISEERAAEDGTVYYNISFLTEDEYQNLQSSV